MIRIASIGECMIELRHRSETELELSYGGDTLNTAVYLARLLEARDAAVDYVSAVGEDPYSDQMLALWRSEGVGTGHVTRLPDRLPGLYTIRTDERGERTFTYWRSSSAARHMLRDPHGPDLQNALAHHDLLYVSGITLGILDPPQRGTLLELAERVRANGGRVVFDSNFRVAGWPEPEIARRTFDEMLRRADIALPTLEDEQRLFAVGDVAECIGRLRDLGVAEVAVKRGELGCHLAAPDFEGPVRTDPVQMVDSTAAGDSFNAGYLAARLTGQGPQDAARLGNRLAAVVIQHRGAIIPKDATAGFKL